MCRSCKSDAPKWGCGVKIPVKDLPRFFESQQSWNFEQKIYGRNVEVLENVRPTITGHLGCRDTSTSRRENQFLVREIFHCPGWRYGCTPRIGCSGKRKNCYALCKVAIYSDNPDVGVVQYAGSHGAGNPTNPLRHRPTNRVRQFIRQQHLISGATPAQLEYAIRRSAIQEGKDINDPRHVPTSAMIRHIVKRARTGPNERKTGKCHNRNKPQNSDESILESLTKVADIVRPIAIKASLSPEQKTLPSPALSPSFSLQSSDEIKNILPLQLAGLADLIIRNQLSLSSLCGAGNSKLPLLCSSPIDEIGSVGSLSPGSPHQLISSAIRSASSPAFCSSEMSVPERVNTIWRPYLAS
ncbi:uncharacterized protein LOC134818562 [Bolinopsis microptera]|uniref:uncharacterized protein LOC134818562 n=1 Tax=Bolinopsis microptera TaxID=2820187 RepID=UPI0030791E51